ncbi:hypothetical protein ACHHYP_01597 [Achlya hypogyna]|uniref:Uncharacterized protein n=1 Tax=Achlya hypogyna TaxID=1202772 RepID=A0A1V9Z886_ACHHY|nr:hypothetical protein ACHHYP_01597 [Achlya hypogyna]
MNRLLQSFVVEAPRPAEAPRSAAKPPTPFTMPPPVSVDDGQYEELDLDEIGSARTDEFFSLQSKSPIIRSMGRSFDHGQPPSDYGPHSNDSRAPSASSLFSSPPAHNTSLNAQTSYGSSSSLASSAASLFEHEAPAESFGGYRALPTQNHFRGHAQQSSLEPHDSARPPQEASALFGASSQPSSSHEPFYAPAQPAPGPFSPPREAASLFGDEPASDPFAQASSSSQPASAFFSQSPQQHHGAMAQLYHSHPPQSSYAHHAEPSQYTPPQLEAASVEPLQEAASLFGGDDSRDSFSSHKPSPVESVATPPVQAASPCPQEAASLFGNDAPTHRSQSPTSPLKQAPATPEPLEAAQLFGGAAPSNFFERAATPPPQKPLTPQAATPSSPYPLEAASLFAEAPSETIAPTQHGHNALPQAAEKPITPRPMEAAGLFADTAPTADQGSAPIASVASPAEKPRGAASLFQFSDSMTPTYHQSQPQPQPVHEPSPVLQETAMRFDGHHSPAPPQYGGYRATQTYSSPQPTQPSPARFQPSSPLRPRQPSPPHPAAPAASPATPPQAPQPEALTRVPSFSQPRGVSPPKVPTEPMAALSLHATPPASVPVPRHKPMLRLNLAAMDKPAVPESPLHPSLLPTPPRSTTRYVPLSPANSVRSDCSVSHSNVVHLMQQYKAMAERLEKEKAELLQILSQQADQFYAMQAYIDQLHAERDAAN